MTYQPTLLEFMEAVSSGSPQDIFSLANPPSTEETLLPVLSTYSGGGFLDLGFLQEGFLPVIAVEVEEDFARAYQEAVHPIVERSAGGFTPIMLNEDIRHLKASSLLSAMEGKSPRNPFGVPVVGILGGPPCQDFSIGGKNLGVEGERGQLVYDFLEKVKQIKPLFFLFENVKGLYTTRKHRKVYDDLVEEFKKAGYYVYHTLLNALEYGVPQDRERVFVVGFSETLFHRRAPDFRWPEPIYRNPKDLPWPTTNPPGEELVLSPLLPRELMVVQAFSGVENLPNQDEMFQPRSKKFANILEGDDSRKSFKRLHRFRYSPTVAYGNNEVHVHPTENRRISVREALRLQTVPDEYILPKDLSLTAKYKLISNGVPVLLARKLARSVRRVLYSALE